MISMAADVHVDGQVKIAAPSLGRMLEWLRSGILPGRPPSSISLVSKVGGNLSRLKIENVQFTLDGNRGMGILDLSLEESVPSISGTLAFDALDLITFASSFTPIAPKTNQAQPRSILAFPTASISIFGFRRPRRRPVQSLLLRSLQPRR